LPASNGSRVTGFPSPFGARSIKSGTGPGLSATSAIGRMSWQIHTRLARCRTTQIQLAVRRRRCVQSVPERSPRQICRAHRRPGRSRSEYDFSFDLRRRKLGRHNRERGPYFADVAVPFFPQFRAKVPVFRSFNYFRHHRIGDQPAVVVVLGAFPQKGLG
jgi:hypothetical protein